MSMDTCAKCGDLVDTDDDPAAYDFGDKCRCETCRAKYYTDDGQKIETSFWRKPIPTNQFDWSAHLDSYDADCVDGEFVSNDPVGYGATEAEAIHDLKLILEEREDAA